LELRQYVRILWRWAWLIVLAAVLAGSIAFVASQLTVPIYEASTTVLINQAPASSASPDYNSLLASERLAMTYSELLRKRPVLEAVITNLKLNTDPKTLVEHIRVNTVRDTQLIELTVEDISPQRAADIANEIVRVFSQQNREQQASRYADSKQNLLQELAKVQADVDRTQARLDEIKTPTTPGQVAEQERLQALLAQYRSSYTTLVDSFEQVRLAETQATDDVRVVEPAQPPGAPVRPRILMNTLLGAIVGAMLAVGMVFLIEYLDDSVKSSDQVEGLIGVSTLATIARIDGSEPPDKLVTVTTTRSPTAEAYRILATNIEFSAVDTPIRTIVVTSSGVREGKSTTVANLAIAIAQTGKRVILVDTDLRRPSLHKFFGRTNLRGLTTALLQHKVDPTSDYLVLTAVDNLRLMPSGPLPPNPPELLGSQRMNELIEELKSHADVVLFDSPPLLGIVDATLLAHASDATLLVVLAASTRTEALTHAKDQLVQSGAHLLGVVLNHVSVRPGKYYDYYYYSQTVERQRPFQRRHGLTLPFFHTRNGSRPGSPLEATEASDVKIASDQ
jgi:capsular exopolysaccharide synthesis family protein